MPYIKRITVIVGALAHSVFLSSCKAFMLPSSCVLAPGRRPTLSTNGFASGRVVRLQRGEIPRGSRFCSRWRQGCWSSKSRKRGILCFAEGGWVGYPGRDRSAGPRWSTAGSDEGEPEGGDEELDSASGGNNDNTDAAQDAEETGSGVEESDRVGDAAMRSSLKQKLLLKVATLNRGFVANEADRADIEELVEMLELENPNPRACAGFATQTSPIAGKWQLLYTTSLDVLSLQLNPTITIGQIFQQIDPDGFGVRNMIEIQPPFAAVANRFLGSSVVTLTVKLETKPVTDTRIDLKFVRTEFKANSLFGKTLDLPALGVDIPQGDSLRGALDKGNERAKDSKEKVRKFVQSVKGREKPKADETKEDEGVVSANTVEGGNSGTGDVMVDTSSEEGGGGDGEAEEEPKASPPTASPTPIAPSLRTPFFETTYVDDELRVGRTGDGDIFISVRAWSEKKCRSPVVRWGFP